MKREDLITLIHGLLLLAGMLLTVFFGGEKSIHGVGTRYDALPGSSLELKYGLHGTKKSLMSRIQNN